MKKLVVLIIVLIITGSVMSQTLEKGNLVGIHTLTITLNPGYTLDQYQEFFMNKYIPEYEKNFPGIKLYLIKGTRGENENSFGLIYLIQSAEVRDKYWPKPGEPSEVTEKALEKLEPLIVELRERASVTSTYTDWVVQ